MRSQIPSWQFYVSVTVFVYGWLPGGEFAKKEAFVHIHAGRSNNPDEISPLHWIIFDRSLRLLVGRIEERIAFLPNPTPSCAVENSRCALAGRRAPFPGNEPLHLMDGASTAAAGTRCVRPGQEEKLPPPGMRQHDVAESWRLSRNFFPAGEATFSLGLWPYLNLCYVRNYSNFDR